MSPVRLNPDVPPFLEQIINKALEKDCELRYQHASELRTDLKRLKRDTDLGISRGSTANAGVSDADAPAMTARRILPFGLAGGRDWRFLLQPIFCDPRFLLRPSLERSV